MKLSIVVSAYKQSKHLENFLNEIFEQESQNFEVILYVDRPSSKDFKIISHYSDMLKERLKVFINLSSRTGNLNWIEGIKKAESDYSTILYVDMKIKKNFISEFEKIVKDYPTADIVETKPSFKGFFKWSPQSRIKSKTIFEIAQNTETLAYTFPFIFNKFFRTSIFQKLAQYDIQSPGSNKYWIELIYEMFIISKTYVYIDQSLVNDWNETLESFNSMSFVKQWKDITEHFEKAHPEYLKEIQYAKIYHFLVFLAGMVGAATKSHIWAALKNKKNHKLIANKLNDHIIKLRESEFKNIIKINKYFINQNKETKFLVSFTLFSKWHTILDKF